MFSGSLVSLSSCTISFCVGFIVFICGSITSFLPCSLFSFFFFLKVIRCQSASMICLLCFPAVSSHLIDLKLRPRSLSSSSPPPCPRSHWLSASPQPPLPLPLPHPLPPRFPRHPVTMAYVTAELMASRACVCARLCGSAPPTPDSSTLG